MSISEEKIKQHLNDIKEKIKKAQNRFGAKDKNVELVAVSKTHNEDEVEVVIKLGQRIFGENRVQEAYSKWPSLKEKYSDVKLHLIGPLQTNKVKDAIALFDVIETLDREKLAKKLQSEMKIANKLLPVFIQVNIGNEPQKVGVDPQQAVQFAKKCKNEYGLNIVGLMAIPPLDLPAGPFFAQLRQLANEARVENLSMGMSKDFEEAIYMGATHVRVGTAIFGSRGQIIK